MLTSVQAWDILDRVPDPEIPVISVTELGIVRDVQVGADGVDVVVTPTYSGCPATEVIERSIREALSAAGAGAGAGHDEAGARVDHRLDRAGRAGKAACLWHCAARARGRRGDVQPLQFMPRVACPRCGSADTERLSQFGATACKALYRCRSCREPFEFFKPL